MAWTDWQPSTSTVISEYRFEPKRSLLHVRSKRSNREHFFECSALSYEDFLDAESQGRFLANLPHVRSRRRLLAPHPRARRRLIVR